MVPQKLIMCSQLPLSHLPLCLDKTLARLLSFLDASEHCLPPNLSSTEKWAVSLWESADHSRTPSCQTPLVLSPLATQTSLEKFLLSFVYSS